MTNYRNRIRALEYVNSSDLTPHPGNWREHPAAQAAALKGVLNEVGIAGALLAYRSERQGGALVVIDGHLRKDAAPQQWPVLVLDVDDAEADYLLATHDPLAAMATADAGALDALLSSVQSGDAAVTAMLAELAEDAGLYQPQDDPQDADPQIDRAEELRVKWGVESGQLWRLPSRTPGQEHRLICGDCTDAAVVERVMGGEKADMVFTDPPYGVEFGGRGGDSIEGDISYSLIPLLFTDLPSITAEKCWIYICGGSSNFSLHARLFDRYYRAWPRVIVWDKGSMTMRHNGYHSNYEFIYYAFTKGAGDRWYGSRAGEAATDVWHIDKPTNDRVHLTEKPVELPQRAIGNTCPVAGIVWEPFCGSASTLIAAENLSRQCRAVEISPGYVAVALERYAAAFNIEPELIT